MARGRKRICYRFICSGFMIISFVLSACGSVSTNNANETGNNDTSIVNTHSNDTLSSGDDEGLSASTSSDYQENISTESDSFDNEPDNEIQAREVFWIDENYIYFDLPIRLELIDSSGKTVSVEEYEYDANGIKLSDSEIVSESNIDKYDFQFDDDNTIVGYTLYDSDGNVDVSANFQYDSEGRFIKSDRLLGHINSECNLTYDSDGRLIKVSSVYEKMDNIFKYDSQTGLMSEETTLMDGVERDKECFSYNEYGLLNDYKMIKNGSVTYSQHMVYDDNHNPIDINITNEKGSYTCKIDYKTFSIQREDFLRYYYSKYMKYRAEGIQSGATMYRATIMWLMLDHCWDFAFYYAKLYGFVPIASDPADANVYGNLGYGYKNNMVNAPRVSFEDIKGAVFIVK